MAQYNENDEIGYEGTIEDEGSSFALLPEGDYDFTVSKVTRFRYEGGDKVPPCNAVSVEVTVWGAQDMTVITERFYLIRKFEWKLSQFFLSLGMKRHGEPLVMNWNIEGKHGKCRVYVDKYQKRDGRGEGQSNKIKKFYAYDEDVTTVSPKTNTPPPAQPTYQQPPQNNGGWKAGSF